MKQLFYSFLFVSISCLGQVTKPDIASVDTFTLYRNILHMAETSSLALDSTTHTYFFETEKSYNLIHHNKGSLSNKTNTYGLSLHSVNDSIMRVRLLSEH